VAYFLFDRQTAGTGRTSADGQVHSWGVLGVGRFRGLRRCGVRQK